MNKYTATVDKGGRLQLPEELRESVGWGDRQWYTAESSGEGVLIRMVDAPEPVEAIHRVFADRLQPLGYGRGEKNNQYVSRWRHRSGAILVSENGQPNIWMSKSTADRITAAVLPGSKQVFEPGDGKPGFHSNVASTPGLKGEVVVKFRVERAADAHALATSIVDQLESVK